VDTASCRQCGRRDTLLHRLTECAHGTEIWEWTRRRLAMILRVDPRYIPSDWLLTPYFHFWPPWRQRAILWILVNFVWYRMQEQQRQTLTDHVDYMRRSRWMTHTYTSRPQKVGNNLNILWTQTSYKDYMKEAQDTEQMNASVAEHPTPMSDMKHWGPLTLT